MIITKLNGGLGNQLFQYSLGRRLAVKHKTALKLDISNYEKNQLRSYSLGNFNIQENFADKEEINQLEKNGWQKIINNLLPYSRRSYIQEKKLFDKNVLKAKNHVCLDGYWQSEKYFIDIENIIRSEITLKNKLSKRARQIANNILSTGSISLHIRRADYLNDKMSKIFEILGPAYYEKAVDKILETENQPTIFIFSDDALWAKNNLKINLPIVFVSGQDIKNYEELFLMSLCRHNIIANSSFSWWGAWLNKNPNKIIIAPNNWFKDKNIETNDLIPAAWQRI